MHTKCRVSHHDSVMTRIPTPGQLFVNVSVMEQEFKMIDDDSVYASANEEESTEEQDSVGLLVDKDDLIKYQLLISYGLLVRIFTYQPTVDKTSHSQRQSTFPDNV